MEYIRSKNLCLLIRDAFKLIDRRLMDHGSRTAYIFYKMLECTDQYEKFELADFVILGTLHDIGAYKTDSINDFLRFESRDYLPHSIYGYLFLKYLSPQTNQSKIILYHHIDYKKMKNVDYEFNEHACILNLAEKVDIYSQALGDKFDISIFDRYVGDKFSPKSMKLLKMAMSKYDILNQLRSEEYQKELDQLLEDYVLLSDLEKDKYLQILMYSQGFKKEYMVLASVTTICLCKELGKRIGLNEDELSLLYYAALIHNIGMLAIPTSVLDDMDLLNKKNKDIISRHIEIGENILKNRLHESVVEIVVAHHERGDGSGYPRKLKENKINKKQAVLQVADAITSLLHLEIEGESVSKEEMIKKIQKESLQNKLNQKIVKIYVESFDDIMEVVSKESEEILVMHTLLNKKFDKVHNKFKM